MELIVGLSIVMAYVVLAFFLVRWVGRWAESRKLSSTNRGSAMFAVFLIAFLVIPLGDHGIGYVYFSRLCAAEGGPKIYRTNQAVEGLWWWAADRDTARSLGYNFVEGGANPESVTRYELKGGEVTEHRNVRSTSRYVFLPVRVERLAWGVVRQQEIIEDVQTKERLAALTSFQFLGGWLVRALLAGFGGTAAMCHVEPRDILKFIASVLQPIQRGR